jgi:DNA end-binding protein Ku
MPRSIWTGAISFGLVNIPIKIYSAVQESTLDLDMLDAHNHANIKFKRVNAETGKEVPYKDIVKGYMYKDDYVILEPEDFVEADAKKTKTIDIQSFVIESEIDSIYYEQPYYLEPDKTGDKAYGMLRDALAASGKVGVTTFVMRNREALAILKPYGKIIVLNRIRFEEEIRPIEDINAPPVNKAKSRELNMALKLIEQLTEKFDISAFKDTYTKKLLEIIKEKATGHKKKRPKLKVVHTKTSDLLEALEASLGPPKKAASNGHHKRRKAS